jgi:hypothetical protein
MGGWERAAHATSDITTGINTESFERTCLDLLTSIETAAAAGRLAFQERKQRITGARGLVIVDPAERLAIGELLWDTRDKVGPDDRPTDWSKLEEVVYRGHFHTHERFGYLVALAKRELGGCPPLSAVIHAGPVAFVSTVKRLDGRLTINYLARLFATETETMQWTGGASE